MPHKDRGKERLEPAPASTLPFPPPQRCLTLGRVLTGALTRANAELKVWSLICFSAVAKGKRWFGEGGGTGR